MPPRQGTSAPADRARKGLLHCVRRLERMAPDIGRHVAGESIAPADLETAIERLRAVQDTLQETLAQATPEHLALPRPGVSARCAELMIEELDTTPAATIDGDCVLRADSPAVPIPAVFELLRSQRKTGTLRCHTPDEVFTLEVCNGDIVHAVADAPPPEDRLGSILVDQGALSAEALASFLARCKSSRLMMGEALQREELVSNSALLLALEEQVQRLFNRMHTKPWARFRFFENTGPRPVTHTRMNVLQLLLESARTTDEARPDAPPRP